MKLNTKNVFESTTKMTPKTKMKKQKKSTLTSPFKKKKSSNKKLIENVNSIKQKIFHNTNKNVNPFVKSSENNNDIKCAKKEKIKTSKKVSFNKDIPEKDDLFENSYINNIALTSEKDTNDKKLKKNGNKVVNINKVNNKKEYDIDEMVNLFKKSSLKSTIIVDNNGNNNLDKEQKKIINDYFSKKLNINTKKKTNNFIRPRIRKMRTLVNMDNNIFNTVKNIKSSTINNNHRTVKFNRKIKKALTNKNIVCINIKNKINNQLKKKGNNIEDKAKTKKMESYNKVHEFFIIKDEKFDIINKNLRINEEKDDNSNSIFENRSSSFNSSFLGSSIDDDFYKNFHN